jgi:hypothetical protein
MFKKSITAAASALVIAGTLAASAGTAEAKFGRKGAFFTGLAVGAIVAGGVAHSYHAPHYYGGCEWRTVKRIDPYTGYVVWRQVRVCY